MDSSRTIYLVGMMGAGKTTVGKKLAKLLDRRFVDIDRQICESTGVTIATIFEIEGEDGFRKRESDALALLGESKNLVVACGGGIILAPTNRARLSCGVVVYLHADVELLYNRTKRDNSRPLLDVSDPQQRIACLLRRRDPLYREVADIVVESSLGPGKTASGVQQALEEA